MSSSTTFIGDRRRAAAQRVAASRRHPASRRSVAPITAAPPREFYLLATVIGLFVMLGLVMVMSATAADLTNNSQSPWLMFRRQAVWAVFGLVAMILLMRVPVRFWRRTVRPFLFLSLGAMFLPFVPGLGADHGGARAWIAAGSFTMQPSEFVKLAVLLYCGDVLTRRAARMAHLRETLYPVLIVAAIAAGMCVVQQDLGSAIVICAIVTVMVFLAGAPVSAIVAWASAAGAGAFLFALSTPFRRDASYQTYQAMIALVNGGWTGRGIGRGAMGSYLPLAQSDFIFAVVAEDLGFVGVFAVVGGFLVIAFCGMQIARAANDRFSKLVAGGVVGWLVVQAFINIGGVIGLLPVTGLTLPFFSQGGSSLMITMTAAGLLLNVARNVR